MRHLQRNSCTTHIHRSKGLIRYFHGGNVCGHALEISQGIDLDMWDHVIGQSDEFDDMMGGVQASCKRIILTTSNVESPRKKTYHNRDLHKTGIQYFRNVFNRGKRTESIITRSQDIH